jgi:hypothetical protein
MLPIFFDHRDPLLVAGNSSLPLNLSGMSVEGVAPTDGQYGYATFLFGFLLTIKD